MLNDPIVLFCSPRGGSSLVAGVFVNHGFWVGKTFGGPGGVGSGGYINYENAAMKQFIKDNWKLDAGVPMKNPDAADLYAFCEKIVPPDTNWMWKGPSEYYPIFQRWFPNMTPVFVFREEGQAIEAVVRRRGEGEREHAAGIIRARYEYMREESLANPNSFVVSADEVVQGYYEDVEMVLNAYGIPLDPIAAGEHIDPSKWHV